MKSENILVYRIEYFLIFGKNFEPYFVLFFLLMGHWLACLWYAIGMTGSCQDGVLKNTSWLVNLGKELGEPLVFDETCNVQQMPDSSKCNQSLDLKSFQQ